MKDAPPDPRARYWPRYCEENVWHLCDALVGSGRDARVIVIAGHADRVAVFRQRAGRGPGGAIGWDYHVVLALRDEETWSIVDADSTLPCPCPADRYLAETFPDLPERLAPLRPRFRVIDAATYRETFSSDRRHMRDARGRWLSQPPPWPPIGAGHDLARFVAMDAPFVGEVVDLAGLRRRLGIAEPR